MDDRIRIVATDGEDTITLGYISCAKQYVFGQVTEDDFDDFRHDTYHENGYLHQKRRASTPDPHITPKFYGPSLENFEGFVPATGSIAVPKEVGRIVSPDFYDDERGSDNITYIDVRNTESGGAYQAFICESGFPVANLIDKWKQEATGMTGVSTKLSYQIYTDPDPWVGVVHYDPMGCSFSMGPTSNFRPMGWYVSLKRDRDPYPISCPNGESGCDGPDGTGPLCMECYEIINDR